ncbi:histidine kinase [Stenotrophomonas humi]|uniref:histidine kinase n=1 Tax=Stenotrophomonas humi TaxID=405444 RepID=A0A0R0BWL4_9GAMM|nr:HAMP domain-containing sensor histidine kinase [Stenotrophomonas humi]KRG62028.1 histidine kinase [Stenotrophomonas humi]
MKVLSLRARLLLAGGLGLVLVSVLAGVLLGRLFEQAARDNLDTQLEQDLLTVLAQAEIDATGKLALRQEPNDARFQRVFSGAYWQIAATDGQVLLQSRSLWDESLQPPISTVPTLASGVDFNGPLQQPLRGLTQQVRLPRSQSPLQVTVASDRSQLDADVARFRQRSALAMAVLITAWLAVLVSQVQFGLRPLRALGKRVEQVRHGDAAQISSEGLGREVAPLANELNALLAHHQRMVSRARSSAQDLAHALKTPLSVLHAEADGSGENWRQTLRDQSRRMQASIDRYLASGMAADRHQRTAVAPIMQALCRLMERVHSERNIRFLTADIDAQLYFSGAAADLEEMLGNLLDNAGRWAAHEVRIQARSEGQHVQIDVIDDGPGLAEEALQQVLQRGVRLDERDGSSGLGLAIVGDIVDSYGGTLTLRNTGSGLCASLLLPQA